MLQPLRSTSFVLGVLSLEIFLGATAASPVAAASEQCTQSSSTLCLNSSRFEVTALGKTKSGDLIEGQGVSLTGNAGAFWFFSKENFDVSVKILNGTRINGHFWVFYGGLTSLEYQIQVKDTVTGKIRIYNNKDGLISNGDVATFSEKNFAKSSFIEPLVPKCHAVPPNPRVGETVKFFDDSSGNPTDWAWSFGDEISSAFSSAERNPAHVYHDASRFLIHLFVSRPSGAATETAEVVCAAVQVRPRSCNLQFSPDRFSTPFATSGDLGDLGSTIQVTSTDGDCRWTVTSDQPYLRINSPSNGAGTGSEKISFQFVNNDSMKTRNATLTVSADGIPVKTFTLRQEDCTIKPFFPNLNLSSLDPNGISKDVPKDVPVWAYPTGCVWNASSSGSFFTISSGSYKGNRLLSLIVSPNTSSLARTGFIMIGNQTFAVNQQGCATATPTSLSLNSNATGIVHVTENVPGCHWASESNASFIHVQERKPTGSNTYDVPFSVDLGNVERLGTLTVADQMVIVKQNGTTPGVACAQLTPPGAGFFDSLGGIGYLNVTSARNCNWQPSTAATFLKIRKDNVDPNKVSFCVAASRGGQRAGRLTLSQLRQSGAPETPLRTSFLNVFQSQLDGGEPALPCNSSDPNAMCLLDNRIEVRATFGDVPGLRQAGHAVASTTGSGYFWLSDASNPELVVKVIDGKDFTKSFWIFSGALTNRPYTLTVTDTKTGKQVFFCNLNGSFQSFVDVSNLPSQP